MKNYKWLFSLIPAALFMACVSPSTEQKQVEEKIVYTGEAVTHEFPALPYDYDALEPYIDATTMELHYSRHHRAYYSNFINAVKDTEIENASMEFIFNNISKFSTIVRNNGGGYYNHTMFWEIMAPGGQGEPSAELASAIEETFGSLETMKNEFNNAASTQFGSGWAWLIVKDNGKLAVMSTANQDNPLMDVVQTRGIPVIALDVWEHAYYLKYQNKRGDYIQSFWFIINWDEVNQRYEQAIKSLQ